MRVTWHRYVPVDLVEAYLVLGWVVDGHGPLPGIHGLHCVLDGLARAGTARGAKAVSVQSDTQITDLAAGTAAEHLVCADLLLEGFRAFLADQNCPYDVAVDSGAHLVRIQVKATRKQRSIPQRKRGDIPAYLYHVRRAGKAGTRNYAETDFDLLALVALDIRLIAYLTPTHTKKTVHIRPPGAVGGKHFRDYPFAKAFAEVTK